MANQPTLRQDGRHRLTLRLDPLHLDAETVVAVLADSIEAYEDERPDLNLLELRAILKRGLASGGTQHFDYCHEAWSEEEWASRVAWATRQILAHWPQWTDEVGSNVADTELNKED
jgi:hypothetical protein